MSTKDGVATVDDEEVTDIIVQRVPYWDPPAVEPLERSELSEWSLYRALIGEFTASLILVYVSISTVIGYKYQSSGADERCTGVGYLGVAWSFGATVSVLVYSTSGVSGGHINPAVSFALFLAGKVSLARAVLYVAAQCLGAICGVGIVKGIMKHPFDSLGGGANTVAEGYSLAAALGAETFGTFVLVYTVFSATDPKRTARDAFVPLVAALPITGTGINPARSLGAAVLYNQHTTWKQVDLLGWALHRRGLGGVLPQDRAARHCCSQGGAAGPGFVQDEQLDLLKTEERKTFANTCIRVMRNEIDR